MPEIKVEIAFDAGFATPMADRTYTDVTDWLESDVAIGHGRADELSTPTPGTCGLAFDNAEGHFTPRKATLKGGDPNPFYPNVRKGKPLRVVVRDPGGTGNLLSANQASLETDASDWVILGGGSVAQSSVRAHDGSKSLLVTWPTTGGLVYAQTAATGLVLGRTYTASAYCYVPAGSPAARLDALFVEAGSVTSSIDVWQRVSVTFVATAAVQSLAILPASAPTAGQQVWVDAIMLDEGDAVVPFTTDAPPDHVRYTGYIDDFSGQWPDASDVVALAPVSCSTRRARLGNTAPLKSAIREAYLATGPEAYWPLSDDRPNFQGLNVFLDITNPLVGGKTKHLLAGFYSNLANAPILNDAGGAGPTDEGLMVKFPRSADVGLIGTFAGYVGAGGGVRLLPSAGLTFEAVARANIRGDLAIGTVLYLANANLTHAIAMHVDTEDGVPHVSMEMVLYSSAYGLLDDQYEQVAGDPADGELHHYALTLDTTGRIGRFYFDGALVSTLTLDIPFSFTEPFTAVALGSNAYNATLWIGHAAVHKRTLTAAELLSHARAAIAAEETPEERVVRVAGRVGVPEVEVEVEDTIARDLGAQPEAGRSAAEVLDEVATFTGGVLYDSRDGILTMQARNRRYNAPAGFTLDATAQEVQADLTTVDDYRYLKNTIEYVQAGDTEAVPATVVDQDSIDEYGVHNPGSLSVVSESPTEVEAFALDQLHRYADPAPRVTAVTVDLTNIDAALRAQVLAADIGTRFELVNLPAQAWADPMPLFIEGYSEAISSTGHSITFNTTPADLYQNVLILDDVVLGELDADNVVAY